MVAIAEGGPQWTSHSIIVVCNLTTNQSAVVKNIAQFIRLLAPSHSQLYIMALSYALLCLYLSSYKLVVYVFHVSNAFCRFWTTQLSLSKVQHLLPLLPLCTSGHSPPFIENPVFKKAGIYHVGKYRQCSKFRICYRNTYLLLSPCTLCILRQLSNLPLLPFAMLQQ